jgi:hypothetical protein
VPDLSRLVPVEDVQPGDTIRRPSGSTHRIHAIRRYPAGYTVPEHLVIDYVAHEGHHNTPVLRCWKALAPGNLVPIARRA